MVADRCSKWDCNETRNLEKINYYSHHPHVPLGDRPATPRTILFLSVLIRYRWHSHAKPIVSDFQVQTAAASLYVKPSI